MPELRLRRSSRLASVSARGKRTRDEDHLYDNQCGPVTPDTLQSLNADFTEPLRRRRRVDATRRGVTLRAGAHSVITQVEFMDLVHQLTIDKLHLSPQDGQRPCIANLTQCSEYVRIFFQSLATREAGEVLRVIGDPLVVDDVGTTEDHKLVLRNGKQRFSSQVMFLLGFFMMPQAKSSSLVDGTATAIELVDFQMELPQSGRAPRRDTQTRQGYLNMPPHEQKSLLEFELSSRYQMWQTQPVWVGEQMLGMLREFYRNVIGKSINTPQGSISFAQCMREPPAWVVEISADKQLYGLSPSQISPFDGVWGLPTLTQKLYSPAVFSYQVKISQNMYDDYEGRVAHCQAVQTSNPISPDELFCMQPTVIDCACVKPLYDVVWPLLTRLGTFGASMVSASHSNATNMNMMLMTVVSSLCDYFNGVELKFGPSPGEGDGPVAYFAPFMNKSAQRPQERAACAGRRRTVFRLTNLYEPLPGEECDNEDIEWSRKLVAHCTQAEALVARLCKRAPPFIAAIAAQAQTSSHLRALFQLTGDDRYDVLCLLLVLLGICSNSPASTMPSTQASEDEPYLLLPQGSAEPDEPDEAWNPDKHAQLATRLACLAFVRTNSRIVQPGQREPAANPLLIREHHARNSADRIALAASGGRMTLADLSDQDFQLPWGALSSLYTRKKIVGAINSYQKQNNHIAEKTLGVIATGLVDDSVHHRLKHYDIYDTLQYPCMGASMRIQTEIRSAGGDGHHCMLAVLDVLLKPAVMGSPVVQNALSEIPPPPPATQGRRRNRPAAGGAQQSQARLASSLGLDDTDDDDVPEYEDEDGDGEAGGGSETSL